VTKNIQIALFIFVLIALGAFLSVPALIPDKITPSVLRVGVLPDENPEVLRNRYAPLLKHLSEEIGMNTQLILPSDYRELSRLFQDGEIDMAYFGGLTFVQASINNGAEALVMRDIDMRFSSFFLSKPDSTKKHLSDFKGMRFSFGSQLSTSGHLMPRYFMKSQLQISPETFFSSVAYSGSHDKTAIQVKDELIDLGVANSIIIKRMIAEGRLGKDELQIVWETPPYVDYVWAVQKALDEGLKNRIRDVFLGLDANNANHKPILDHMGAVSFIPSGNHDFLSLERTARNLGMLGTNPQ